jgi:hypothetical protein
MIVDEKKVSKCLSIYKNWSREFDARIVSGSYSLTYLKLLEKLRKAEKSLNRDELKVLWYIVYPKNSVVDNTEQV